MKNLGLQWLRAWILMPQLKLVKLTHRPHLWSLLLLFCSLQISTAQVVINEIFPDGSVELKNLGSTTVDVSSYWLCDFPDYQQISNSNLQCGDMMMPEGSLLTVDDFNTIDNADGEMGLYTNNTFADPAAMIDYVEWGSTGHQRSTVAVAAGIWSTGDFVPAFAAGESLEYSGAGEAPADWSAQAIPTLCEENGGGGCTAEGGTIEGGPFSFCVGDGIEDNATGITLSGNTGTNSQWVVTDEDLNILGLPPTPEAVNFDEAGGGVCLIWHLSFEDGLEGAAVGNNAADLVGCFNLSNSITVTRTEVNGGTIEGGPFSFCVGDGIEDNATGITLSGNTGTNSQWVITDDQGNILGLPPSPEVVNFDDAPAGTCLIWHLSFEDGLEGAAVGNNAADLVGCFSLSNPITVNRNDPPSGGTIEGGPFEFCVGDGVEDNVSGVTLSGNTGTNSQWVVTDEDLNILGLPPTPEAVNFDDAPGGTCLIWHLSFEDGLTGAEVGMNAADLGGCFGLSNSITVVRNQVTGGTIEGGPFSFCVGDGIEDNATGITLSGNTGTNSQWVVTDDQGNILGLPPSPEVVNFDDAPAGTCLIWHLSFEDGLEGAAVGNNAADLVGCFSLSNSITVTRNDPPSGGTIEGGPFEFCVGDGVEDNVSGVTLSGNTGTNSQWVVTDEDLNILGLPPTPEAVNFDDAPDGTCLIWHLSFEDGLTGAEVGMNAADLGGCFGLSNSITVVRNQVTGGTIEGGPFSFCVGDGIEDNATGITLSGNTGTNSQWVITDDQGNILGLPPSPEVVNFDDAPAGTCLIWHLSFEDGLEGAAVGNNAADLVGCFSLSNPITVTRNDPPSGGTIEGGPFEFCVGDGVEDNVSGVTLTGNTGTNSQWVVTDEDLNILGLPPTPEAVNFDDAPGGTCLIWHLSFEDGLTGAEIGMNAADLGGCFGLSNSITVVRNQVTGGTLEGGPFSFCVGDGEEDNVSGITLIGNVGTNSQWVVTDGQGNILGLPPTPEAVNFDDAPAGICLIWHLSYEDGLEGAAVGNNAADLVGCFNLSNPLTVNRNEAPSGGTIEGGPFEFCVGDGVEDNATGITLSGNTGTNSQWVVTDDQGNILGLPPTPEAVNFDDAPAGICLIWHLSYEDGLEGAAVGNNAADLVGCYSLSNPITVTRLSSGDPACGGMGDNNYVLVAIDDLDMERNIVHLGGVGVTDDNGEAEISEESQIVVNGTFIKADEIHVNSGASVNNAQAVPAMPDLPAFMENPNNPGNDQEVVVDANETVILTEEVYEDIKVKEGATIIFSGQNTVYIEDLETKSGVTILFDQCTNLVLSNKMYLNYDNQFNPGEENVFVFADDDISIRPGSTVYGVIYTLEKLNIRKGSPDQTTQLYGMFIGEDIRTRDYAEYWYQFFAPCNNISNSPTTNKPQTGDDTSQADTRKANLTSVARLAIYPNPASDLVYLSVNKVGEQTVEAAIYSATNQLVSTRMSISIEQGEVELNVGNLPAGVYFVKVLLESGETITEKLIVTK